MLHMPSNAALCMALEKDYVKSIRALKRKHDSELKALLITYRRGMPLEGKPHPQILAGAGGESAYKAARDALISAHDAEYAEMSAPHIDAIDYLRKKDRLEGTDNAG